MAATAFLYDDGSFVFSAGDTPDAGKTLVKSYTGWDTARYGGPGSVPWYNEMTSIISVSFDDVVSPVSISYWFYECEYTNNFDATNLDTSKVTSMSDMFYDCSSLTSLDLSSFDTSKVTSMSSMFDGCSALTSLDLSSFDTSKVTDMSYMFSRCKDITSLDLSSFDTSKVTSMSSMFYGCPSLTSLDLSSFDTSKVTDMSSMFDNCAYLTTIYASDQWSTSAVTSSTDMFYFCFSLTGGNGTTYNSSIIDVTRACIDTPSTAGYLTYKKFYPFNIRGDFLIQGTTIYDIASAIRSKTGLTGSLKPSQMADAIKSIGAS